MAKYYLAVLSTLALIVAAVSGMKISKRLNEHQRMMLAGGGFDGKRSPQNEIRPQLYDNMMDDDDSEKFQMETLRNPLAWYLANLSPEKRHLLSKLLEMTRMEEDMNNE